MSPRIYHMFRVLCNHGNRIKFELLKDKREFERVFQDRYVDEYPEKEKFEDPNHIWALGRGLGVPMKRHNLYWYDGHNTAQVMWWD